MDAVESLKQFQFSRFATLQSLENIVVDKWNVQPVGYANTVQWNAGHIYISAEFFLHKADNNYEMKHAEWSALFATGTRPSEWNGETPTPEDIMLALTEQKDRIMNYFDGNLQNVASESISIASHEMNNVDAFLQFVTWHEGIHTGIIKSLNNAIK